GLDVLGDVPLPKLAVWCDAGPDARPVAERLRTLFADGPPEAEVRVEEDGGRVLLALGATDVTLRTRPAAPLSWRTAFAAARAHGPESVSAIPRGATMAFAGPLELGRAFPEARLATKKLDEFHGLEFEGRLDQFKAATGIDLQADLADALGDEWAIYTDPATG